MLVPSSCSRPALPPCPRRLSAWAAYPCFAKYGRKKSSQHQAATKAPCTNSSCRRCFALLGVWLMSSRPSTFETFFMRGSVKARRKRLQLGDFLAHRFGIARDRQHFQISLEVEQCRAETFEV